MKVQDLKPVLVSVVSALAASLCCLLPLAVIVLGLGSGAFMATTTRYQAILLPIGILGVAEMVAAIKRIGFSARLHDEG